MPEAGFDKTELMELCWLQQINELSAEDATRLEDLITGNTEACDLYLCYFGLCAGLEWSEASEARRFDRVVNCAMRNATSLPVPPVSIDPSPNAWGVVGDFSSGWPMAYLLATVIVGVGLLVGAFLHISSPARIATQSPLSQHGRAAPETGMTFVGRITGMVDCQWADPNTAVPGPVAVPLGRRYVLASGLMEITYDTGAQVILQGPCEYKVESAASGLLSVGKLTAKIDKKEEGRTENKDLSASHSSFLIPRSYFAVRTPTAIVTDLGTEFGVEVNESGTAAAHVFRGEVEVQPADDKGQREGEAIRLTAQESVWVEKSAVAGGEPRFVVHREAASPESFVRKLPASKKPLPVQVVTHFRLGEDDRGAVTGKPANTETANGCRHLHLARHGSPSYAADTAAPGSTLAISFNATNEDYFSNSQWYGYAPIDNFIFEAWARVNKLAHQNEVIAYIGNTAQNGYGIMVRNGNWAFLFGGAENAGGVYVDSGVKCESDTWTHLALICVQGRSRLWIDGQPTGNVHQGTPSVPDPLFLVGGNSLQTEYFDGQIDEVRLSLLRGPFQPEMLLLPKVELKPYTKKSVN